MVVHAGEGCDDGGVPGAVGQVQPGVPADQVHAGGQEQGPHGGGQEARPGDGEEEKVSIFQLHVS